MQIEHQTIELAEAGEDIGLQVAEKVQEGTEIYKLVR